MGELRRLVVFTGDLSYATRKAIVEVDRAAGAATWLIVVSSGPKPVSILLRNQWRNLVRNGWRWIPYQCADIAHRLFPGEVSAPTVEMPGYEYSLAAFDMRPNFELLRVGDLHADSTLAAVARFRPELGLSLAAPILREALFTIPALGTLNLHKGRVPDYRGMPPAFWELWNGEPEIGCTVHWVDKSLDTGAVAAESAVACQCYSTLRGLQLLLDELAVELLKDAVTQVLRGTAAAKPQAQGGRTNRKPTLAQMAELTRRSRRPPSDRKSGLTRFVREGVFSVGSLMGRRAFRLRQARAAVLLYHRVTDQVRDNLTVGIEQFERQMALIRKHCEVVPIERVVDGSACKGARKPVVCVTFDDGYLDNYENAAPILQRHGIPAAFFIATGIIESDRAFPHDIGRGHGAQPVMTWAQLRRLRAQGFTIGSHTVSHIDCAAESEGVVKGELAQSRDDIRRLLEVDSVILAYPYGGRDNMTAARLEWVKQAGYVGCLSAYGGVNKGAVDPFNVLRRSINWEFSDRAFLCRCFGL